MRITVLLLVLAIYVASIILLFIRQEVLAIYAVLSAILVIELGKFKEE